MAAKNYGRGTDNFMDFIISTTNWRQVEDIWSPAKLDHFMATIFNSTKVIDQDPKNAEAYYDRAFACCMIENWEIAVADFSQAIKLGTLKPHLHLQAFSNRGKAYIAMGKFNHAIADLHKVMELLPPDHMEYCDSLIKLGDACYGLGNYDGAIADYGRAIKNHSSPLHLQIRAHFGRGKAAERNGDVENAKSDFAKVKALAETGPKEHNYRQLIRVLIDDFGDMDKKRMANEKRIIDNLTRAIESDPTNAKAHYDRAIIRSKRKDWKDAIGDYSQAISLGGLEPRDFIWALFGRSEAFVAVGELELGLADLNAGKKPLSSHPELFGINGLPFIIRGDVHYRLGEFDNALANYGKAINHNSGPAEPSEMKKQDSAQKQLGRLSALLLAHCGQSMVYRKVGETEKAESAFTEARELARGWARDNNYPEFFGTQLIESAEACHANNEKARMANADAYFWRSVRRDEDDWEGIIADNSQCISLGNTGGGNDVNAFYNRGEAYLAVGEFELAIADLDKGMEMETQRGHNILDFVWEQRGDAKYGLGNYASAVMDYSEAIKRDCDLISGHYALGMAYEKMGETEKAKTEFTKAEEMAKEHNDPELIGRIKANYANLEKMRMAKERDAALNDSRKPIEPDPMKAEDYFHRAVYKDSIEEDWEGAIADYSRAISLGTLEPSEHLTAVQNRGELYADMGEFELAIEDLKSLPDGLLPHYGRPYVKRGDAHCGLGNYESAKADYSEAIKFHLDPVLAVIPGHYGLGVVYEKIGEPEKAKLEFAKAEELAQEHNEPELIGRIKAYRANSKKLRAARAVDNSGNILEKEIT